MSKARAFFSGFAVSVCLLAASAIGADKHFNDGDRGGDGFHDTGHIYIDNFVGDPNVKLAISNSLQANSNSEVSPTRLFVMNEAKGTITYAVHHKDDDCLNNNLDISICAAPVTMTDSQECSSSTPKCDSGDITSQCYIGTSGVE